MLKIFNDLGSFFRDNYRRMHVREYSRAMGISPPSASKLLQYLHEEGLLNREEDKNYIYYAANKASKLFVELSRAYWLQEFEKAGLVDYLEDQYVSPLIILFGSFSKAEIKKESDIDLAVFSVSNKAVDLKRFEEELGRKIQLFAFRRKEDVKNKELLNNILCGFVVSGSW